MGRVLSSHPTLRRHSSAPLSVFPAHFLRRTTPAHHQRLRMATQSGKLRAVGLWAFRPASWPRQTQRYRILHRVQDDSETENPILSLHPVPLRCSSSSPVPPSLGADARWIDLGSMRKNCIMQPRRFCSDGRTTEVSIALSELGESCRSTSTWHIAVRGVLSKRSPYLRSGKLSLIRVGWGSNTNRTVVSDQCTFCTVLTSTTSNQSGRVSSPLFIALWPPF
ncbi:hypothetical protein NMY22_g12140 [Coprinellus aureogranulatus]|nr:hypothetical protein NMY22_g12140 [Coprinellus aureogranulatus]